MAPRKTEKAETGSVSAERIERTILLIRGERVMLDADLAEMYGVPTKVLVQTVKRNADRFPPDFMFQLTQEEFANLRSQSVTSSWGGRRYPPFAFTEHGVAMLSSVVRSTVLYISSEAVIPAEAGIQPKNCIRLKPVMTIIRKETYGALHWRSLRRSMTLSSKSSSTPSASSWLRRRRRAARSDSGSRRGSRPIGCGGGGAQHRGDGG